MRKKKPNKQTKQNRKKASLLVFPRADPQSKRLEQAKQRAVQALQHSKKRTQSLRLRTSGGGDGHCWN